MRTGEQLDKLIGGPFLEALREKLLRLGDGGILHRLRIRDLEDPARPRLRPAGHPVGPVERAVGSELAVGRQHAGHELVQIDDLEAGSLRLRRQRPDDAAAGAAGEVGGEEVIAILIGQADAGIVRDAGGAVAEMGQRRRHVRRRRSARPRHIPDALGVEGAAVALLDPWRVVVGAVLVAAAPAALAALRDVDPAGHVAGVGVVVVGEEIAGIVEGELLRIAQAAVDQFQMRPVRLAAKHGPALGVGDRRSLLRRDVERAIADREVEPAVGPHAQAVQVVARVLVADAVAGRQLRLLVGDAGPLRVAQHPDAGDAGEVDLVLERQDAGRDAVGGLVEALGEDGALVGHAGAGRVPDEVDLVVVLLEAFVGRLSGILLLVDGQAIGDGLAGDVVLHPVHVAARVGHAGVESGRLGDVEPALVVEGDRDRIFEQRLRGPEFDLEVAGDMGLGERILDGSAGRLLGGRRRLRRKRGGEGDGKEKERGGRNEKTRHQRRLRRWDDERRSSLIAS